MTTLFDKPLTGSGSIFLTYCLAKCLCKPNFVLNLHALLLNTCAELISASSQQIVAHGVIGNTPVFGTVIQGSSPCGPTRRLIFNPAADSCRIFFFIYSGKISPSEPSNSVSLLRSCVLGSSSSSSVS